MPGPFLKHVDAYCCYNLDSYENQGANPVAHGELLQRSCRAQHYTDISGFDLSAFAMSQLPPRAR